MYLIEKYTGSFLFSSEDRRKICISFFIVHFVKWGIWKKTDKLYIFLKVNAKARRRKMNPVSVFKKGLLILACFFFVLVFYNYRHWTIS